MSISDECKQLMQQESLLFERDYKKHFLEGETKPRHIGEPYLLHHPETNRGVLLIHGLMAAPEEVREWADFLYSQGYTVYAPRLAGHGTSALDLAEQSFYDWVDSVNRGHNILKACCEQIVVAGFSTGAGLALHQAVTKPGAFKAVISISAPLKFKSFSSRFAEQLDRWNLFLSAMNIKRLHRDFVVNHPDNPDINYHRCPVRSIVQVKALMKKVYAALPTLFIPALIIQADNDPKVEGKSGRNIYKCISSPDKTYREVHFHLHGIIRGEITRNVFPEVADFLNRLTWR
ncbi:MAG TPA: alpha/beta fold hydrolase [Smithella sp.]|nr:alpha/beta fold hydrolase [Smithella sp.]